MMQNKKIPSPWVSLLPILVLVVLLFFTISIFGSDALSGGSQICLLFTTALCTLVGMAGYRIPWKEFECAIVNNITGVSTALIILLIIGALSAAWMLSGVVPTLIYYGVQIIHPRFFLVSCCIICAVVSVMTGSSWTTIATIGIALMGIGKAQGFAEGWTAGAIISGAYFGDKISPLSDTTVLASSVTETPLFTHIRYMMFTTVPSLIITLILFTVAGFFHTVNGTEHIALFTDGLSERFHISLWLLLVPVVTGILIAKKVPSIITLFLSTLMAVVFMLLFQPEVVMEIAGDCTNRATALFKGTLVSLYSATSLAAPTSELGMLGSITSLFVRFTHRLVGLVASTVGTGLFLNLATADQYISIILTGNMFKGIYEKEGYESRLLSRTTEDAVTVTSVLIPWNTCGMTQATILGVPTLTYLPYCFFNYISPLMSILVAAIGYKIVKPVRMPKTEN